MSVFRPSARATGPDGREWEVYAYRFTRPPRGKLRRYPIDLVAAALRARRSDTWTIEAVTWGGHRERHRWVTTAEYRRQVLLQVEGGLERGDDPRPRHATYIG